MVQTATSGAERPRRWSLPRRRGVDRCLGQAPPRPKVVQAGFDHLVMSNPHSFRGGFTGVGVRLRGSAARVGRSGRQPVGAASVGGVRRIGNTDATQLRLFYLHLVRSFENDIDWSASCSPGRPRASFQAAACSFGRPTPAAFGTWWWLACGSSDHGVRIGFRRIGHVR